MWFRKSPLRFWTSPENRPMAISVMLLAMESGNCTCIRTYHDCFFFLETQGNILTLRIMRFVDIPETSRLEIHRGDCQVACISRSWKKLKQSFNTGSGGVEGTVFSMDSQCKATSTPPTPTIRKGCLKRM